MRRVSPRLIALRAVDAVKVYVPFMLLQGDRPVDPMPYFGSGTEALASDSIESLIGHIIRVESAGNASARNPRSTATGRAGRMRM